MNILESFRPELETVINQWAVHFKIIGMGNSESPRWAQIMWASDLTGDKLVLKSTQVPIWYEIPLSEDKMRLLIKLVRVDSQKVWAAFRELRNEYLKQNHPTIKL